MLVWSLKNINRYLRGTLSKKVGGKTTNSKLYDYIFTLTGFYPNSLKLYEEAFCHSSVNMKDGNGNIINYERLEFLGDSVLGMVVSEYLYIYAPNKKEGYLTQMRSKIVNRNYLNEIGHSLLLENYLIKALNHSLNNNISGNILEALIGAIYLDRGFEETKNFILKKIITSDSLIEKLEYKIVSYRSYLLEWAQKNKKKLEFKVYEEVNANNFTIFVCEIYDLDKMLSRGRDISKKKAVEMAAKRAYYALQKDVSL